MPKTTSTRCFAAQPQFTPISSSLSLAALRVSFFRSLLVHRPHGAGLYLIPIPNHLCSCLSPQRKQLDIACCALVLIFSSLVAFLTSQSSCFANPRHQPPPSTTCRAVLARYRTVPFAPEAPPLPAPPTQPTPLPLGHLFGSMVLFSCPRSEPRTRLLSPLAAP